VIGVQKPTGENVFILSNPQIDQELTVFRGAVSAWKKPRRAIHIRKLVAMCSRLEGFAKLHGSLDGVTVVSSGTLPDAEFVRRYKEGATPFAPNTPGLLATLTYDVNAKSPAMGCPRKRSS